MAERKPLPAWAGFVHGGVAGMGATCIVQPMDTIKTRLQLSGAGGQKAAHSGMIAAFRHVFATEGFTALYSGLSAGLLRQATYTTARMGFYAYYKELARSEGETTLPFWKLLMCGGFAGASGAMVGVPAEVALIRMQADGALPAAQRRGYKHVGDALVRTVREEGLTTLWRGAAPTVGRAAVLNMAQLSSYDQYKKMLSGLGLGKVTDLAVQLPAAFASGLTCTLVSMPFDMAKTRLQSQVKQADGSFPYKGMGDVLKQVLTWRVIDLCACVM
mmetsp:Transcript_70931/g.167212  ORF Transcript_70931/g.167212 Transcript_70931/m.167212 type:complete len:273 (-) Transcript_70931:274-1092(-)